MYKHVLVHMRFQLLSAWSLDPSPVNSVLFLDIVFGADFSAGCGWRRKLSSVC